VDLLPYRNARTIGVAQAAESEVDALGGAVRSVSKTLAREGSAAPRRALSPITTGKGGGGGQ